MLTSACVGGRYWLADTYDARHAQRQEPQSIDKEFLRLWFREHCDPYKDEVRHSCCCCSTNPKAFQRSVCLQEQDKAGFAAWCWRGNGLDDAARSNSMPRTSDGALLLHAGTFKGSVHLQIPL